MKVTLEQMLAARDRRAEIQSKMLERAGTGSTEAATCLLCLTLNIAGDVKRTPMTRVLFDRGVSEIDKQKFEVLDYYEIDEASGTEGFWLLREDAEEVKRKTEAIEEDAEIAASRLLDFDVLTLNCPGSGEDAAAVRGSLAPAKLSRKEPRKCLLCESPAAECARSRRHGLDAVKDKTENMLREFCADTLAQAAYDSLIAELEATPKPGLVDLNNNGAHKDMDEETLRKSAAALLPYFRDAAILGMAGCNMKELRRRGIEAERGMFAATGGVNTHKGMVYSMGLLIAGMAECLSENPDQAGSSKHTVTAVSKAVKNAADLAREDADEKLRRSKETPRTNGAAVYKKYNVRGATGHAAAGFPDALYCAERLAFHRKTNDENAAAVFAFIDSIEKIEDTNLLHRGGADGLSYARERASEIASLPVEKRMDAVYEFDEEMIERNLSPGGSADMLALAFLINKWKKLSLSL